MTAARKIPAETKRERDPRRMSAHELFAEGLKRVDAEGLIEAGNEYGDDFARELADLQAGRHPSQRSKPPR